jgi:F-BAR domain only protein
MTNLNRIFTSPWQKIVEYTEVQAESHTQFARNIERDVEKPLRDFTTSNREIQNMGNMTGNLQAIARDVEGAEKKADKLKDKGGKASADKVATAASSIEDAKGQWESQAPYVFEKLQAVDEMRLEHLRSCLTQFQTFGSETHSTLGTAAEQALNSLLNLRIADEIQHFVLRIPSALAQGQTTTARERRMSRAPTASSSVTAPPITSSLAPPPIVDDVLSHRLSSSKRSYVSGNVTNDNSCTRKAEK